MPIGEKRKKITLIFRTINLSPHSVLILEASNLSAFQTEPVPGNCAAASFGNVYSTFRHVCCEHIPVGLQVLRTITLRTGLFVFYLEVTDFLSRHTITNRPSLLAVISRLSLRFLSCLIYCLQLFYLRGVPVPPPFSVPHPAWYFWKLMKREI